MSNRVEHPSYYQLENGIEIIDIIRYYCDIANAMKYISRAGLKSEEGMSGREKEIEDCRKALWYLDDYLKNGVGGSVLRGARPPHPSGIDCETVAACYHEGIAQAFRSLWYVGLVVYGSVHTSHGEEGRIVTAMSGIRRYIEGL